MRSRSFKESIINMLELGVNNRKDTKHIIRKLLLFLLAFFLIDILLYIIPALNFLGYMDTISLMWVNFFIAIAFLIGFIGLSIKIKMAFSIKDSVVNDIGYSAIYFCGCLGIGIVYPIPQCLYLMFAVVLVVLISEQVSLLWSLFELVKISRQD